MKILELTKISGSFTKGNKKKKIKNTVVLYKLQDTMVFIL